MSSKPVLITITGPTCSGKSTFARALRDDMGIPEVRSFTTRPKRAGEVDGVDYDFLEAEEVEALKAAGEIAEHVELNGCHYGSTKGHVRHAFAQSTWLHGQPVASIVVDPNGVTQFEAAAKEMGFDVFTVYVGAPTPFLVERFLTRFLNDPLGSAPAYTTRLLNLLNNEAGKWYQEINWHFDIQLIDDGRAWATTDYWVENLHLALTNYVTTR